MAFRGSIEEVIVSVDDHAHERGKFQEEDVRFTADERVNSSMKWRERQAEVTVLRHRRGCCSVGGG